MSKDEAASKLYNARLHLLEHGDYGSRYMQDAIQLLFMSEYYLRSEAAREAL